MSEKLKLILHNRVDAQDVDSQVPIGNPGQKLQEPAPEKISTRAVTVVPPRLPEGITPSDPDTIQAERAARALEFRRYQKPYSPRPGNDAA